VKNLFQNLDLYKVIILASLVLLPIVGFWAYHLDGELKRGRQAIVNATRRNGHLEEIGKFEEAVEKQVRNRGSGEGSAGYSHYFNKWIVQSAPRLRRTNFSIGTPQSKQVQNKAIDTTVSIDFKDGNKRLPLSRGELKAILFNVESQSPVWKLRTLSLRNVDIRGSSGGREPIATLEDKWEVQQMEFASRRPLKR
jgi:hypothetical protein